ncbi:hypothetical protein RRG08_022079 [Elysia crispata]|uniref:Uncharacterized protein n=1 Tax=Elysia crispata TaxID=231223 RepID=A0AAE0Y1M5_9GAST|nr:hypothetical protein RRG08_022079 [Elysia crispata]
MSVLTTKQCYTLCTILRKTIPKFAINIHSPDKQEPVQSFLPSVVLPSIPLGIRSPSQPLGDLSTRTQLTHDPPPLTSWSTQMRKDQCTNAQPQCLCPCICPVPG